MSYSCKKTKTLFKISLPGSEFLILNNWSWLLASASWVSGPHISCVLSYRSWFLYPSLFSNYCKVWVITKWDSYYKVWRKTKSVAGITKYDRYYKVWKLLITYEDETDDNKTIDWVNNFCCSSLCFSLVHSKLFRYIWHLT